MQDESKKKKVRVKPADKIKAKILDEYHHKCAICGRYKPQIHHIDEDPSNNDPLNLIPLCPNHHLQDIHNPTAPYDPEKIRLFRRCKDPFILDSRFHPIWTRLQFLRHRDEALINERWNQLSDDLEDFAQSFQKGPYYCRKIREAISDPYTKLSLVLRKQGVSISPSDISSSHEYDKQVSEFRARTVEDICVEMLRYQNWEFKNPLLIQTINE